MNESLHSFSLRRTARHEAGHASVAYLLRRTVGVVSIRPTEHYAGIAFHSAPPLPQGMTRTHLGHPIVLLPAQLRRFIETSICILKAGDIAAQCVSEGRAGYIVSTPADEESAVALARLPLHLTREEADRLEHANVASPTDNERAWRVADAATDDLVEVAAYLGWLEALTRSLVRSSRCQRLILAVEEALLEHEVLSGRVVREVLRQADEERPRDIWAAAASHD